MLKRLLTDAYVTSSIHSIVRNKKKFNDKEESVNNDENQIFSDEWECVKLILSDADVINTEEQIPQKVNQVITKTLDEHIPITINLMNKQKQWDIDLLEKQEKDNYVMSIPLISEPVGDKVKVYNEASLLWVEFREYTDNFPTEKYVKLNVSAFSLLKNYMKFKKDKVISELKKDSQ